MTKFREEKLNEEKKKIVSDTNSSHLLSYATLKRQVMDSDLRNDMLWRKLARRSLIDFELGDEKITDFFNKN